MGDKMENSLTTPLHIDENMIHIDIRHKKYYPEDSGAQTVTLPDGTIITIIYDGVMHYISVLHPTYE